MWVLTPLLVEGEYSAKSQTFMKRATSSGVTCRIRGATGGELNAFA
jgi:hypothetical protein